MEYGINIDFFRSAPLTDVAKAIADAGFTCVDYRPPVMDDNWEITMKEACKIFREYGLRVHQTHVPYRRPGTNHRLYVERSLESVIYMGAKYAVVHGNEFDFDKVKYTPEAAFEFNHNYFRGDVEFAKKNGFKMAFETVFDDHPVNLRYTSRPHELFELVTSFSSTSAVCCWDFGHANISFGESTCEWILKFGSLIECTHVHDNTGSDSHQMPFTGDINWNRTMDSFKKIGYNNVLSIEYSHGNIPADMLSDFLRLSYNSLVNLSNL